MAEIKRIVIFIGNANNFGHTRTTMSYISCFLKLNWEVYIYCRDFNNILHDNYKKNINVHFYKCFKYILGVIRTKNIRYALKVDYDLSPIIQLFCKINKIKLLSLYCTYVNRFRYYNEKSCVVISNEIRNSITNLRYDSRIYLITNRVTNKKLLNRNFERLFNESSINVIRITQFSNHYQQSNVKLVHDFCKIPKKYKLWLFGSGDNRNIKVLKNIIKNKEINCTIKNVNSSDLDNYILDSDIVIGTGRTAIDALYFGKPLVVPCFEGKGIYVTLSKNNIKNLVYNNLSGRNFCRNYTYSLPECFAIIETGESKNFVDSNYHKIFSKNYSDENLHKMLTVSMFKHVDSGLLSLILGIFKYISIICLIKVKNVFK